MGIYRTLTDACGWKLELRPRNSLSNFFAVLVELLGIPAAAAAAGIVLNICNQQSLLLSHMAARSLLR